MIKLIGRGSTYLVLFFTFAGCTIVTSSPYDKNEAGEGITYSLPKPIVRVVPQGDGSANVGIEFIPDNEHTYYLTTDSYLSSHKVQILRAEGMLTSVQWSSNSTGAADDLVKASGDISKSVIDAQVKMQNDSLATLKPYQESVIDAQNTVELDKTQLLAAYKLNDPTKVTAAQQTLDQDTSKLNSAQQKLQAAQARQSQTVASPTAPTATAVTASDVGSKLVAAPTATAVSHDVFAISGGTTTPQKVWGPVLYSIDEREVSSDNKIHNTVVLRAIIAHVNPWSQSAQPNLSQQQFETVAPKVQSAVVNPTPGTISVAPSEFTFIGGTDQKKSVKLSTPATSIGVTTLKQTIGNTEQDFPDSKAIVTKEADNITVDLSFSKVLPTGKYKVAFQAFTGDASNSTPLGTVTITVTVTAALQ